MVTTSSVVVARVGILTLTDIIFRLLQLCNGKRMPQEVCSPSAEPDHGTRAVEIHFSLHDISPSIVVTSED
jgi:hypothetical protein